MKYWREKKMNNKVIEVQEIIFEEMKRLNDDKIIMSKDGGKELARSTALYNQATNYIKAVNTNLRIIEMAKRTSQSVKDMTTYLGLDIK